MTKAGAGDWKTPLGYYERAIAELIRTREEIRTELQNFKEISQIELQTLKAELQSSYQAELQPLKAELQTTKDRLATTQQTADEALARVATAETAANAAQTELESVKAELQTLKAQLQTAQNDIKTIYELATNLPIEELIWLKQNIGGIKQLLGVFGRK